jgi:hypothetical protein
LLTALLEPAARVALVGGEERGTWMLEHRMASATSFAFAAIVTRDSAGAAGRLEFLPSDDSDKLCPTLEIFTRALAERRALHWHGCGGAWTLAWS